MKRISILIGAMLALILASCEHTVEMNTKVSEDGKISKTIRLLDTQDEMEFMNPLGITAETGWEVESGKIESGEDQGDLRISFSKDFDSVEAVNLELNSGNDTLFLVESNFEKEFRWFYTYIHYSETFKKVDRFKYVNQEDFFTQEEYAFIDRLPALGGKISKADSLFLDELNDKIYDVYGSRGMYEDVYKFWETSFRKYGKDVSFIEEKKESFYELLMDDDADIDFEDDSYLFDVFDSLGIEFPHPEIDEDITAFDKEFMGKLKMASWAGDGKFVNIIELPWDIVETNADSVEMNIATWRPSPMKFLLNDYTMTVSARKMNLWAVMISGGVVLLTIILLFRRRLSK